MRVLPIGIALALLAPLGCSADAGDQSAISEEELLAKKPIPYVLQYVGSYDNKQAAPGQITTLTLTRTGRYTAKFAGSSRTERGVYFGPSKPAAWPLVLQLVTSGHSFKATEGANGSAWGSMRVTRNGKDIDLAPRGPAPGESICDSSGGTWADDDADPLTGLYCACPQSQVYIPGEGGCVK